MNLSDVAIKRPVFTTMMMVALMVLGITSFLRLGVDLFPDISFPVVTITTPYPGAGPEEIEQEVTKPIEDAVSSLSGIDSVRSYSREGVSLVVVVFKLGTDIKLASVDVRDRATAAHRDMPDDVEESSFLRLDPSAAPVLTLVVGGEADPRTVRHLADDTVRPILEQAEGVAAVNVRGGAEREIEVRLSAERLAHYGLDVGAVSQALKLGNMNVPAGRFDQGATEATLRVQGQFTALAQVGDVVVARPGGAPVRVRDLGEVVDGSKERRTLVRIGGEEAVSLEVIKQAGANTIAVADASYLAIERARRALPPGVKLEMTSDSSVFVRENTEHVLQELVLGAAATIVIIFLFMLDWRSTFISSLALPTSVVTTFFGMYLAGFTLNMMSLMGLSLSIGFLIDDAIVVRENIFRHLEMGEEPMEAASKGTKEIALAVLATTASILAVFIPVAFTSGIIGQFFRQFAATVAVAVAISLFVAFTLDPMLSARLTVARGHGEHGYTGVLGRMRKALDDLDEGYRGVLAWALDHRKTVIAGAIAAFVASLGAVGVMGTDFFPKPDRGQFSVAITMPPGTSLERTTERVAELERILMADPDIVQVYAVVGPDEEARKARMRVTAVDKHDRSRTLVDLMDAFRKQFAQVPDVKASFNEAGLTEGDQDIREMPIDINLRGPDMAKLEALATEVSAIVAATPGVTDVTSTLAPGQPEIGLVVDRDEASAFGLSPGQIGLALRSATVGDTPTRFREGEDDYAIRVRLAEADRSDPTVLAALPLRTLAGLVPLRQVASLETRSGPATIEREDRQRQISITANVLGRSLGEVVGEIEQAVEAKGMPEGYTFAFAGEAERMRESMLALTAALGLAIIFIYIVLASQFESFVHPLTIMVSLPLAIVGAFLGLFLTGKSLGMSAFIGVILLMGLVTKNAILLVDRANQLRDEEGLEIVEALLRAGPTRLRPILMTSAAIVVGMLPTALSTGPGSEFRSPMSISVIGGVVTSTFLTLLVVPIVYVWLDRFTARHRRVRARQDPASPGVSLDKASESAAK
jgi:hydrophobe/amphiphile efflux-1 (HAE1) family protein